MPLSPASSSSPSSRSTSTSDDDNDLELGIAAIRDVANHFRFDPLQSSDSEMDAGPSSDEEVPADARMGHAHWCQCGHCRPMETELESLCCKDVERVRALIPEEVGCITAHPTFQQACLNIHTLAVAYYALMNDRPGLLEAPEIHRSSAVEVR
ncbi:uncharacterized protein LOC119397913 [Rhipicephalus sanguineus]|uniref:uncharacterized protein LOC119397913 n=1 Tax=Rhipicephalus sanguineus TaxID=34632 RepID=UPI0020C3E8C9|nr:uncharacterized protein LOC119397913 [Rhipicephalus sanguineus]